MHLYVIEILCYMLRCLALWYLNCRIYTDGLTKEHKQSTFSWLVSHT